MPTLTPIATVVQHFGIPLSTLHYWERRGLIIAQRRGGRRCYDTDQLYRIDLIRQWQSTGLMSLDEIAVLLSAPSAASPDARWRALVHAQLTALEHRMAELDRARDYLHVLLTCPHRGELERCPNYRATVSLPGGLGNDELA
ncbi:MerR family transcriptional regulator [Nocardia brasiliensis]|uniref:helix-turn-helix domain-containing protein n=1 Tax=Nocardia brasiliensis TaxID=37326 RepID=UPI00366E3393